MVKRVSDELGPIDTLVLNAAIQFPVVPFTEYPWEAFQAKLMGELGAAFFCCKAVVPTMIKRRRGCIIAVSSGLSRHAGHGFCAHSTAKSGLDAFAKSLALELGPHGIRVNVVAPGLTITDATEFLPQEAKDASARATPMGRNAQPEDIAGVVLAMAADTTGFVTGAYVPVSGGSLML
jgi:3-oxoacyl-[acyl-carrier protein] reductase